MAINVDPIIDKIQQLDIEGIINLEKKTLEQNNQEMIAISFLRLRGALKGDKKDTINMIIGENDPDEQDNFLKFLAMNLEECEPGEYGLTIYMDANNRTSFGAHKWNPENGRVHFTYTLPLPEGIESFPNAETFKAILQDMYDCLLFREYKEIELRTKDDDFMTDEEKNERMKTIEGLYDRLIGIDAKDNDSI